MLEKIEESYPNPVSLETLCSSFTGSSEAQMRVLISELQLDKKIKALEHNLNSFTRVQAEQEEVTVVKQMPKVEAAKQPTIAIITSQYFEKMAVDAMMTNRQTFVRYATVGEWECAGVPLCSPAFINPFVIVFVVAGFIFILSCPH